MKRIMCIVLVCLMATMVFGACAKEAVPQPIEEAPEVEQAEATPSPAPEPVITVSDIRLAEMAAYESAPDEYTCITLDGVDIPVYAFTDPDGMTQFRAYAERDTLADDTVTETEKGFISVDIAVSEDAESGGFTFSLTEVAEDAHFIDPDNEQYGQAEPQPLDGMTAPVGYVMVSAASEEEAAPVGLCSYKNVYGDVVYRVHGTYDPEASTVQPALDAVDTEAAEDEAEESHITTGFYPANEDGTAKPGALMADCDIEVYYILADGSDPVEQPTEISTTPAAYIIIDGEKYPVHPPFATKTEEETEADTPQADSRDDNGKSSNSINPSNPQPPTGNSIGVVNPTPQPQPDNSGGGNTGSGEAPDNGGGNTGGGGSGNGGTQQPTPTPTPAPTPTPTPQPSGAYDDGMAQSVFSQINSARTAAGLTAADWGGKNARERARQLVDSYSHSGGDECIYKVAGGAGAIVSGFQGSASHWNALMSPTAFVLTVGVYVQDGIAYCCIKIG